MGVGRERFELSTILDHLDEDEDGYSLKPFINYLTSYEPSIADDLENISVSIYDKIERVAQDPKYMPSTSKMLKQLIEWGIFEGVPNAFDLIYGIYGKLSPNVHVLPDYIDRGRILVSEETPFKERKVIPKYLLEYLEMLHTTMDVAMVGSLNILKENIQNFEEVRDNLASVLNDQQFMSLELQYTPNRIMVLLK